MIEKKLSIRKLYKGKFPTKDSVRLTAEAVAELQREVIALERLLVSKVSLVSLNLEQCLKYLIDNLFKVT